MTHSLCFTKSIKKEKTKQKEKTKKIWIDGESLMKLCVATPIEKIRYIIPQKNLNFEVDLRLLSRELLGYISL